MRSRLTAVLASSVLGFCLVVSLAGCRTYLVGADRYTGSEQPGVIRDRQTDRMAESDAERVRQLMAAKTSSGYAIDRPTAGIDRSSRRAVDQPRIGAR